MTDANETKPAFIITTFDDAGTGEHFTAGTIVPIGEGAFGNYAAGGLVREPTDEEANRPSPPDYERDGLKDLALTKASAPQLFAIAAFEKAEVPEGDKATKADLIRAIEAKRQPPA